MGTDTEYAGHCQRCQKRNYRNRKTAKLVARRFSSDHLVAYRCPHVRSFWHIGHLATPVIRGVTSREEIYRKGAA